MKVVLNVGERVAVMASLRAKKSDDMTVLLDYHSKAKSFALDEAEKAKVHWSEPLRGQSATYLSEQDGAEYKLDKEFEVDDVSVRIIVEQMKALASQQLVTAGHDDLISAYEKLTNPTKA